MTKYTKTQLAGGALGAIALVAALKVARKVWRRQALKSLMAKNTRVPATAPEDLNGGILVAETLKAHGVKFLFTLCGGHISTIMVGCKKAGIRVLDVRDEATTVFAADGVSRMSDSVGVAAITAGPGLTNTITAVKNAQMAQSPVIILSGAAPSLLRGRGSLQDIDQRSAMLPHVKAFFTCNTTSEIVPALQEAFKIAREGVPGPVCIEYPLDVIYTEALVREFFEKPLANPKGLAATLMSKYVTFKMSQVFKGLRTARIGLPIPHHVPQHTEAQAKMVFNLLKGAKKPLLLVGAQSLSTCFGDGTTVAAAVAALGVPVYLASGARGLLGTASPLQFRHNRRDALKEADVVVLFGVVTDFRLEYGQHVPRRVKLVSVNLSQEDLNRGLRLPDVKILADPGRFLADLGQMAMKKPVSPPPEWFDALNAREAKREAAIQKDADNETLPESGVKGAPGCNPVRLLKLVEKTMASDAIIVADGGDFVGTAAYTLRPRGPLKWLDPGPFGTLGVAGGFALAAAALNPGKEVWIIWGDGSSGYSIAEYDTFVRHGMKVISIIGNDACWTQICRDQKVFLEDDVGCMLAHTDYHTVAQGWGAAGIKISNDAETKEKLDEAVKTLNSGKPVVINAILRQSEFRKGSISM